MAFQNQYQFTKMINNRYKDDVYYSHLLQNSTVRAFLSGSTSGVICTVLLQPLDVVKTRLQNLSGSVTTSTNGKPLFTTIISNIIKEESIKGFWKGTTPTLVKTVPGIGLYFGLLTHIKSYVFNNRVLNPTESVLVGIAARSIAGAALMPLTVVKTRVESGVYNYAGVTVAIGEIFKTEGLKGLTRGLVPTIFRDAPYAGIYLMLYTQSKSLIPKDIYTNNSTVANFSCAVISSTLACLVTQPPDVFKTQMQLYPHKFNGMWPVIIDVYVRHGAVGYFQGILPRLMRRTLVAAISWTLYEKIMKSSKRKY
ncbi:unnamed protein product [Phyllotreta striolata]|uniref:Mitochondrial glycine transporter n=1 Tax=Phyllotreta striolata TaxID=444603 RepID=A0A9N9XLH7_PHYSR|nr:unnamed protein product [Phyllotreta striolata]